MLAGVLSRRLNIFTKFNSDTGYARSIKSNILSIAGISSAKKGDIVNAGDYKAWVYGLYEEYSLAAILSDDKVDFEGEVQINPAYKITVPVSSNSSHLTSFAKSSSNYTFQSFLKTRPPYLHIKNNKQLLTGYHQIDLCQPLSYGQSVLFYGKPRQGKTKMAYEISKEFIKHANHKVVISSINPFKQQTPTDSINYINNFDTSDVSQYFNPFIALAHAVYLRDQGNHVLFIIDDILYHTYKERSTFHPSKIMPCNIGSLAFEHSKHVSTNSSLSSIFVLNEDLDNETHRLLTLGLGAHLRSFCSHVYNFGSRNNLINNTEVVLDFTKILQTSYNYQFPIFKKLRNDFLEIFSNLNEMQEAEEIRKIIGIVTDPWEKYLYLDSKYFIKLLCQTHSLKTWELIVFIEFIVYSVKNEMISLFKIDMEVLRTEFLTYIKGLTMEVIGKLISSPDTIDIDWGLRQIDEKIIKIFYIEAKMKDWLRDYQDDYEEPSNSAPKFNLEKLKFPVKEQKSVIQKFLENITTLKN